MALTAGENEYLDFLNAYSGKDDAKTYVDNKILFSNKQVTTVQQALADTVGETNALVNDAQQQQQAILTRSEIPEYDIEDPTFNADSLTNEKAPEDPALGDKFADPDVAPLVVEEWDTGAAGEMPDSLNLAAIDTSALGNLVPPSSAQVDAFPDVAMAFTPAGYVSGLMDFLTREIESALGGLGSNYSVNAESNVALDGNTGSISLVDPVVEQAIYDKAKSRMDVAMSEAVEQAEIDIQARGFSLPPGALSAALSSIQAKHANAQADLGNDIIVSRVGMEQKRTEYELTKAEQVTAAQFKHDDIVIEYEKINAAYLKTLAETKAVYLDSGTKLENVLADIHRQEETLLFETDKENVASILKVYDSKVEAYKSLMEAFRIESETAATHIKADTDYNQSLLDIFLGEIEAAKGGVEVERVKVDGKKINAEIANMEVMSEIAVISAENSRLAALAGVYESTVRSYAAKMDGLKTAETLDLMRYDVESKGKAVEIGAAIDKAALSVESVVKVTSLQIEALKSQASLSASIISSALNSMNTSASFDWGGSLRGGFSSSKGEGVSYGYSYSGACEDVENPKKT